MQLKTGAYASVFALAIGLGATPAFADVEVYADIVKEKEITVDIEVFKTKDVAIFVDYNETLESGAEAMAITNQVNNDNQVGPESGVSGDENGDLGVNTLDDPKGTFQRFNYAIQLSALIDGSINNNSGFVGVNQDVGNMVNQANTVATAAVGPAGTGTPGLSFTHSEASAEQINTNNRASLQSKFEFDDQGNLTSGPDKEARVTGSVLGNSGIVGVNQNVGNMTNQANNVALSVGLGSVLALSESDLGQENAGHVVLDVETFKRTAIVGSVNGNQGIVAGNQNAGNFNNQANSIAFSALTSQAAVTTPGAGAPNGS